MLYAMMASVMFGVGDVFTKTATFRFKSVRILILNALFTLPVSLLFFIIFRGHLPGFAMLVKVALIQSISVIAMLFMFLALTEGPVSVISSVIAGYSAIGVLGGAFILKEMPSGMQYAGIITVLTGTIAICYIPRSKGKTVRPGLWIMWTILTTVLWGIWSFMTKTIVNDVEPWTISLIFAIIAPVIWLPYIMIAMKGERGVIWSKKAVMLGIVSIILVNGGGILFYISLKHLPVSIAAPVTASHPLFTVALSYIFLKERLYVHQIISLFLIIAGLMLLR